MWFDKCNWARVQFPKTNPLIDGQQLPSEMDVKTNLKTVSRK